MFFQQASRISSSVGTWQQNTFLLAMGQQKAPESYSFASLLLSILFSRYPFLIHLIHNHS